MKITKGAIDRLGNIIRKLDSTLKPNNEILIELQQYRMSFKMI